MVAVDWAREAIDRAQEAMDWAREAVAGGHLHRHACLITLMFYNLRMYYIISDGRAGIQVGRWYPRWWGTMATS